MNENRRKTTVQSPVYCSTLRHLLAILSLCFLTTSSAWGDYQAGKDAYERGDYATALKEFRPLAEQGNAKAQHYLGVIYRTGRGVRKDEQEGEKWYRMAHQKLRLLAEQGDAEAQLYLGDMYRNGRGVRKDEQEEEKWYRMAHRNFRLLAEQGDAKAQYHLGVIYRYGLGVRKNDEEAVRWYRKAAEQGQTWGQDRLGFMYANGRGVRKNDKEAVRWYRKAAEQGHVACQSELGVMYYYGRGVQKNYAEAVRWYRKAAEQGYVASQSNLGVMYEKGRGVGQDYITAYMWYILATAEGTENEIIRENFKSLTKKMTRAQIAEARRRADEWKRRKEQQLPKPQPTSPSYPPDLVATIRFSEMSGNNFLDANEKGMVAVTVENRGKGRASRVRVAVAPSRIEGISYTPAVSIGDIAPGESRSVKIPIDASLSVRDARRTLAFEFSEKNGFPPDPVQLNFETRAYVKPRLVVVDVGVDEPSGNGMIEPAEVVTLTVRVQNQGAGNAKAVQAKVSTGNNVFIAGESKTAHNLGELKAGDFRDFSFSVYTNKIAIDIPVFVDFAEATGLVDVKDYRLPISLKERVKRIRTVVVEGQEGPARPVIQATGLSIDIEQNIPHAVRSNPDAVAVVIGISDYQKATDVLYARRDAQFVREYLIKTFGYDPVNILPRDPDELMTAGTLKTLIRERLPAFVKQGKSDVFVYYSGHGSPSTNTNEGFLVPSDCDPNYINADNAYRLQDFYGDLSKVKGRSLTVVLDACFSGMTGDGKMLIQNISPIVLPALGLPSHPLMSHPQAIVLTSTSNDRVSNWYPAKQHSLFTYFFLKGLQGAADSNADSRITVSELEVYLLNEDEGVRYWSNRLFGRPQTPQVKARDKAMAIVEFKR